MGEQEAALGGLLAGAVRPTGLSGALFRKSYSLSAGGGNLTLSLASDSTKSRSSGQAAQDGRDVGGSGMSTAAAAALSAEGKGLSVSSVRSVHWMGMEKR